MKFRELVQTLTDKGVDSINATLFVTSLMPYQKADDQMLRRYNIKIPLKEVNEMLASYHDNI